MTREPTTSSLTFNLVKAHRRPGATKRQLRAIRSRLNGPLLWLHDSAVRVTTSGIECVVDVVDILNRVVPNSVKDSYGLSLSLLIRGAAETRYGWRLVANDDGDPLHPVKPHRFGAHKRQNALVREWLTKELRWVHDTGAVIFTSKLVTVTDVRDRLNAVVPNSLPNQAGLSLLLRGKLNRSYGWYLTETSEPCAANDLTESQHASQRHADSRSRRNLTVTRCLREPLQWVHDTGAVVFTSPVLRVIELVDQLNAVVPNSLSRSHGPSALRKLITREVQKTYGWRLVSNKQSLDNELS